MHTLVWQNITYHWRFLYFRRRAHIWIYGLRGAFDLEFFLRSSVISSSEGAVDRSLIIDHIKSPFFPFIKRTNYKCTHAIANIRLDKSKTIRMRSIIPLGMVGHQGTKALPTQPQPTNRVIVPEDNRSWKSELLIYLRITFFCVLLLSFVCSKLNILYFCFLRKETLIDFHLDGQDWVV